MKAAAHPGGSRATITVSIEGGLQHVDTSWSFDQCDGGLHASGLCLCGGRRADAEGHHVGARPRDRAGRMRVFIASDNPSPHSLELARRKAYTARTFRRSTLEWRDSTDPSKENAGQRQLAEVIPLGGGYPINVGNDTIGGVGVSGNNQAGDEACAKAGVEKVADQLK